MMHREVGTFPFEKRSDKRLKLEREGEETQKEDRKEIGCWAEYEGEMGLQNRKRNHIPLMKRTTEPSLEMRQSNMSDKKRKWHEAKFGRLEEEEE